MALKRSFFSRLFGSSSAQEETAEESAEEHTSELQSRRRQRKISYAVLCF